MYKTKNNGVINKFALDLNNFNSLNCENVVLLDKPDKIFLSVRLQSYVK
jgi:hypothetical protein